jgi:hypothetical protein
MYQFSKEVYQSDNNYGNKIIHKMFADFDPLLHTKDYGYCFREKQISYSIEKTQKRMRHECEETFRKLHTPYTGDTLPLSIPPPQPTVPSEPVFAPSEPTVLPVPSIDDNEIVIKIPEDIMPKNLPKNIRKIIKDDVLKHINDNIKTILAHFYN